MSGRVGVVSIAWVLVATSGCASAPSDGGATPSASAAGGDAASQCIANANKRPKPGKDRPEKVRVSHVLVKHAGSKRPKDGVSRTRGEACLRAAEARDKIVAGMSFDDAVKTYSDEDGAATRGGSVGDIEHGAVDEAFEEAAFDLSRGDMSDVVETPFGFHLILRTE